MNPARTALLQQPYRHPKTDIGGIQHARQP